MKQEQAMELAVGLSELMRSIMKNEASTAKAYRHGANVKQEDLDAERDKQLAVGHAVMLAASVAVNIASIAESMKKIEGYMAEEVGAEVLFDPDDKATKRERL